MGIRYDIDDMGAALGWNINRQGVVFVQATAGRDIDALVRGTGEASTAVLEALLALEEWAATGSERAAVCR